MDPDLLHEIAENAEDSPTISHYPDEVSGRVLVADADHLSYKACNLDYSYADNVVQLDEYIHAWRRLAGAEVIELHTTLGHKGDREKIAVTQPYQGNRIKDEAKSERVHALREYMASGFKDLRIIPKPQYDQEADDSCCQAMWENRHNDNYVLLSPDKDLWMVGGLHLNHITLKIEPYTWDYGKTETYLTDDKERKIRGMGTSWFWHQMLMGDSADNIPGLQRAHKDTWIKHAPTKTLIGLQRRIITGRMPSGKKCTAEQKQQAVQRYTDFYNEATHKTVGKVMANKILGSCISDRMAFGRVSECYRYTYGNVEGMERMGEQGRLLWMRREKNQDVRDLWRELGYLPSTKNT